MSVKVQGLGAIEAKLEALAKGAKPALLMAELAALQDVGLDAKARCPVDTGALAGSIYAAIYGELVEIGFGGPADKYAVRVHEDLSMRHPNGGEAKFLTRAMDQGLPKVYETIAALMKRYVEKGIFPSVARKIPGSPWG